MKTTLLEDVKGRKALYLSTEVYDSIKDFILSLLSERGEVSFLDLLTAASQNTSLRFVGDLNWCFLVVKRDLEARHIIDVAIGCGRGRAQIIRPSRKKRTLL